MISVCTTLCCDNLLKPSRNNRIIFVRLCIVPLIDCDNGDLFGITSLRVPLYDSLELTSEYPVTTRTGHWVIYN